MKKDEAYGVPPRRLNESDEDLARRSVKITNIGVKYKYIRMVELEPKPKTKVWRVEPIGGEDWNEELGIVKWYAPWRQYCFFPSWKDILNYALVFSSGCLRDIVDFLETQTKKHKEKKK
jgi:hypothetical protein